MSPTTILLALGLLSMTTSMPSETTATIDRIEDNNMTVIEVVHDNNIFFGDVPTSAINSKATNVPVTALTGTFQPSIMALDSTILFPFDATNGDRWTLTYTQLGFWPEQGKEYTIFVSNNWTPTYIYDDFFICLDDRNIK